jgi:hypothetical protein
MNNRLSDEDRAYTARMLGGCGLAAFVATLVAVLAGIAALAGWLVLS